MMGGLTHSAGLAFCLALLSTPARSAEIVCASQSAGYQFCRADTSRGVTLIVQLGPFACNKGDTWDFDKGGVWVANGCTARFLLGPPPKNDDAEAKAQGNAAESLARDLASGGRSARRKVQQPPAAAAPAPRAQANRAAPFTPSGAPTVLVCESKQYKLTKCPVPVRAHVYLRKKLGNAECRFNATWGYDFGEIWVTDGCRAEFDIY